MPRKYQPRHAYDASHGRPATADPTSRWAAATAWPRRLSRRVARMATPTARLLARAATCGRLVRAGGLVRAVELVGRRLVLGRGAGRGRYLLPAPEPGPPVVASRRRPVARPADPPRRLLAHSPQPRLGAVEKT